MNIQDVYLQGYLNGKLAAKEAAARGMMTRRMFNALMRGEAHNLPFDWNKRVVDRYYRMLVRKQPWRGQGQIDPHTLQPLKQLSAFPLHRPDRLSDQQLRDFITSRNISEQHARDILEGLNLQHRRAHDKYISRPSYFLYDITDY